MKENLIELEYKLGERLLLQLVLDDKTNNFLFLFIQFRVFSVSTYRKQMSLIYKESKLNLERSVFSSLSLFCSVFFLCTTTRSFFFLLYELPKISLSFSTAMLTSISRLCYTLCSRIRISPKNPNELWSSTLNKQIRSHQTTPHPVSINHI